MPKVNRNAPRRSTASESMYTVFEFDREFPDDAACLEWLKDYLYPDGIYCPKCEKVTKHHRQKSRPSYSCQFCGHRIHPMKGTIFENSATSLKLWFYGMYLMASTRCGISAKQLERELGVTYKTAWRMFKQIRSLLTQDETEMFGGTVEVDETYVGGKEVWKKNSNKRARADKGPRTGRYTGSDGKDLVVGMAQRKGEGDAHGKIAVRMAANSSQRTLLPIIATKVVPDSVVYTDELPSYGRVGDMGYRHSTVKHKQKVYVMGDVHTNTVEGFWSLLKRGISGVYHGVSREYLQTYIDEYVFRYNNRAHDGRGMFNAFLGRIETRPDQA